MPGRSDPFGAFNFLVQIDGIAQAAFMEVTGMEAEIVPIEYREGGDKTLSVRKLPGLAKYSNIVLKRGITPDHSLWDWFKQALDGNVQRKTLAIILLDDKHQPVVRWAVHDAWPCKYAGPVLNAKTSDVAIETLEICHEGLELVE